MNEDLIKRIEALEAWKAEKERQLVKFPLDAESIGVLTRYFMRLTRLNGTVYEGNQDEKKFSVTKI